MDSQIPSILKGSFSVVSASSALTAFKPFSEFGDDACGEPLPRQRILMDFTPREEDTDFLQRKCCAFWKFIKDKQELRRLRVMPEVKQSARVVSPASSSDSAHSEAAHSDTDDSVTLGRTALSMLEFVEGKGLIDRTFEAKLPQSMCSLGSREYRENERTIAQSHTSMHRKKLVCNCQGTCKSCSRKQPPGVQASPSSPEVKEMCRKLQTWSNHHPKTLDPPGHPPALSHAVMQRNITT